jgi:DNA-binding CsgD family transcriptional regulator
MKITDDNKSKSLLDLIDCLYCSDDIYDMANSFFTRLNSLFVFHGASLWLIDANNWEMVDVIDYRFNSIDIKQHKDKFIASNVFIKDKKWYKALNCSSIYSAKRLLPNDQNSSCDYNYHTLSVISGIHEQPISVVHLYRMVSDDSFKKDDVTLFNRIAPHLARAIKLDPKKSNADPFGEPGILVYTVDGEFLLRNQRSRDIAPGYSPEKLLALALKQNRSLDKSICCYLRVFKTHPKSLLHWIDNDDLRRNKDDKQYNMVVVTLPFLLRQKIERKLQQSLLSPRELDVALNAIQGFSNAEIASRLYIDETTVKDHLHRVYNKMSVRSRTALVSRVLNLDKELAGMVGRRREMVLNETLL